MITKKGINASPGVAIGPALVLDTEEFRIPSRAIDPAQVPQEIRKLDAALDAAREEVAELRLATSRKLGAKTAEIFTFHEVFIADPGLRKATVAAMQSQRQNAARAFALEMNRRQREFLQINDAYLRERVRDLYDIEKRVLRHILGRAREDITKLTEPVVIVAHDITPSQAASFDHDHILGFAINVGGPTSHFAILARKLGVPAVVALTDITSDVSGGETIVVDGSHGIIVCNPDDDTVGQFRRKQSEFAVSTAQLAQLRDLPAVTKDELPITLLANIEQAEDVRAAMENGAEGVGLYRTEFLFLAGDRLPGEQEQFEVFRSAIRHAHGKPITIRTLDLGADKMVGYLGAAHDQNPVLGLRSLRYCLQHLDLFKTHLRAILRASAIGHVRIMFPMVTTLMEMRQARATVQDVMEDLEEDGIAFARDVPLGIMVETPACAMLSSAFAKEVAFMSIGTNDLTQYTLAVDRGNELVAHLYAPHNPAVLRLIREVVRAARRNEIDATLCGEMAGEPLYTELLIGIGLRTLSMAAKDIPAVKRIIRMTTLERSQAIARKALRFQGDREVANFLRDELRNLDPRLEW